MYFFFEPEKIVLLASVVEQSQAKIVLSTFWRGFQDYVAYVLYRHGIPKGTVIDKIPENPHERPLQGWENKKK